MPLIGGVGTAEAATTTLSVTNSPTSAGEPAVYNISLGTNATNGGLAAGSGTVTLTAPPATVFPPAASDYYIDGTVVSTTSGGGNNVITLTTPVAIPAGSTISILASPVTNTTTVGSGQTFTATTATPTTSPLDSGSTTITTTASTATAVTGVSVVANPNTSGATNAAYTVGFKPTTTGASTITLTPPAGTTLPLTNSDYTVTTGGTTYPVTVAAGSTTGTVVVTLPAGVTLGTTAVSVNILGGVTNPTVTKSTPEILYVATSTDTENSPSSPYTIVPAGTSVSNVSLSVSPTTAGPTTATYTTGFTTTTALTGGTDTITLTAPSGTAFPSAPADYTIASGGQTLVPATVTPSTNANQVTITAPVNIPAASSVTVTASNVTNPAAGTYTDYTVNTSKDTTPVAAPSYTITAASTVIPGTVTPSNSTAGQPATYKVTFTAKTADSNPGTITFTAPTGTTFTSGSNYTVDGTLTSGTVGSSANTVTITIPTGVTLSTVSATTVVATGVTNPAAGTYTNFMVSTSKDTTPAPEASYTINPAPTQVTPGTFSVSPTSGGSAAQYNVNFTTGSNTNGTTGVSLAAGTGTITLSGISGTVFPLFATDYTVNGVAVTVTPTSSLGTTPTDNVILTVPQNIAPSASVTVVGTGITNPAAGSTQSISVNTSTDKTPVAETNTVTMTAAGTSVTAVTVGVSPNTVGALATYTVGFTTTHAVPAGDTVTITAPAGTSLPSANTDYTFSTVNGTAGTTQPAPGGVTVSNGGTTATITLPPGVAYNGTTTTPNSQVITVGNVTNPGTAGYYTATVATQTDTAPATSNAYAIGSPSTAVSTPKVSNNPTTAAALTTDTVTFTTSSTGPLSAGTSTITVSGNNGVVLPTTPSDYTVNGVQVTATPTPASNGGDTITVPVNVPASSPVTLVISGATNPTTVGTNNTLTISTSSDTVSVVSAPYTTSSTTAPTVTSLSPTSGATTGGTTVTITGTGFLGATGVNFGTKSATNFTVINDTTVVATSPAGAAGPVNVTVTNPAGTSATSSSDVFTYVTPGYVAESPVRVFDSRTGETDAIEGGSGTLAPGTIVPVTIAGVAGVPMNAKAVAINVTAIGPSGVGNLRVYPDTNGSGTTAAPNASNINYITGSTVANFAIVQIPADGKIDLQSFGSKVDVAIDVVGYFSPSSAFVAMTPNRVLDTRPGSGTTQGISGPIQPGTAYAVMVTGGNVPANATSVAINVTAIQPTGVGNLRVFPSGAAAPNASTINYNPNNTTANYDIVKVPANGMIDIETYGSPVNVAIDVTGYTTSGITNIAPVRILDTRPGSGIGTITGPVQPNTVESVQVAGDGTVPANAQAVLLNVTAVGPQGGGNLRVYPDSAGNGMTQAGAFSTINYITGQDTANFVIVQLPADGKVDFESFGSATNVLFDVVGYIPAGA